MLVRIAALVAVDAPPVSYLLNLAAAADIGIDADRVSGVLAAIAPIVGTPRVASATGKIAEALEVAIERSRRSMRKPTGNCDWSEPARRRGGRPSEDRPGGGSWLRSPTELLTATGRPSAAAGRVTCPRC